MVHQSRFHRLEAERTKFAIIKELNDGFYLVRRKEDGETLLGHRYDIKGKSAMWLELLESEAGVAAEQVLNHENLVAPQGYLTDMPAAALEPRDFRYLMLWDFCDAGTLADLFDKPPCLATPQGFLPESLVWHVAISLLRALQWLHEGIRDEYDAEPDPNSADPRRVVPIRKKTLAEKDWFPILHCDMEPENIYLSHPRGIETYGLVKLGNFAASYVCGKILANDHDSPLVCLKGHNAPLKEIKSTREKSKKKTDKITKPGHAVHPRDELYFHVDELASLGAILYRMMTGHVLPPFEMQVQTDAWEELQHHTQYSAALQETVMALIKLGARVEDDAGNLPYSWRNRASVVLDGAWTRHMEWRTQTEDGLGFLDVFDDQAHRRREREKDRAAKAELANKTLAYDVGKVQDAMAARSKKPCKTGEETGVDELLEDLLMT